MDNSLEKSTTCENSTQDGNNSDKREEDTSSEQLVEEDKIDWTDEKNVSEFCKCGKLIKESYNSSASFCDNFVYDSNNCTFQGEQLYKSVMDFIINNSDPNLITVDQKVLLQYVQDLFEKDEITHQRMSDELKNNPIKYRFAVTNIKIYNLSSFFEYKANDTYFKIYLEFSPNQYTSQVKMDTSDLILNELYEFSLTNVDNNMDRFLCIELWQNKQSKYDVKYFKRSKSVLIGTCKISVESIIFSNETMHLNTWENYYTLNRGNDVIGKMLVKFSMGYSNENTWLHSHLHLLRKMLLFSSKQNKDINCWLDQWTSVEECLLKFHAEKLNLPINKQYLSKWIVYCQMLKMQPISFHVFYDLLQKLVNKNENNFSFTANEIKFFWDSAKTLLHSSFYFIKYFKELSAKDRTVTIVAKEMMKYNVKTLSLLSSIEKPYNVNLFSEDTIKLFENRLNRHDDSSIDIYRALELIIMTAGDLLFFTHKELQNKYFYKDIFKTQPISKLFEEEFNINYTKILYMVYAKHISEFSKNYVKFFGENLIYDKQDEKNYLCETFLLLFFTIQEFTKAGYNIWKKEVSRLELNNYHSWFKKGFQHYFNYLFNEFNLKIDEFLQADNYNTLGNKLYTKSVIDMLENGLSIKKKWIELKWPCCEFSFTMIMSINERLLDSYIYYAQKLENRVNFKELMFKDENKFYDTAANNIRYLIKVINDEEEKWLFKLEDLDEEVYKDVTETQSKSFIEELYNLVESRTEHLEFRLKEFLMRLSTLMSPIVKRYIRELEKNVSNFDSLLEELIEYLNANFSALRTRFFRENYNVICNQILLQVLDEIQQFIKKDSCFEDVHFGKVYLFLNKCIKYIDVDFSIIMKQELEIMMNTLHLKSLSTNTLIEKYIVDSYNKRMDSSKQQGSISVDAFLNTNNSIVIRVNSVDIRPSGTTPLENCKMYVKIDFVPPKRFSTIQGGRCRVTGTTGTLADNYVAHLTEEHLQLKNSMIYFEIWQKELLLWDKFIFDAFLPLRDVKKINLNGPPEGMRYILKLGNPQRNEIHDVLKNRKKDKVAMDFINRLKVKLKSVSEETMNKTHTFTM